jgi:hypothetical protein
MTTPDTGVTIRFPSTALLTIDSEDRWAGYTQSRIGSIPATKAYADPFNFTLQGQRFLLTGAFTRLGVSEVVMPWCPNINPKTCKMRVFVTVAGIETGYTLDLTPEMGFNNPKDIATICQAFIRAFDPTNLANFTFTYGNYYNALGQLIQANAPAFFYNVNGSNATDIRFAPMLPNSTAYPYPDTTKQLFDVLGFNIANEAPEPFQGGDITYAQSIRYVDIVAPYLTQYQGVFDGSSQRNARDSLCRVYLGGFAAQYATNDPAFAPIGTVPVSIYRNFTNPKQIQWIAKQNITESMLFQVYGDDGQLFSTNFVEGPNCALNWSMTLLVSEN